MTTALAPSASADRILTGVFLMLAFCVLAPLLDVSAKLATATLPVGQIVAARFFVQAALMLPVTMAMRLRWRVDARMAWLITARALSYTWLPKAMSTARSPRPAPSCAPTPRAAS